MKYRFLGLTLLWLWLLAIPALAAPVIKADQQYFDVNSGLYILEGNVSIEVKNRLITAGQAKVNLGNLTVWGAGGVSVTQDDLKFRGDSVTVYGSQDKASITGHVELSRSNLSIAAEQVEYNWREKIAEFSGNVKVVQDGREWSAPSVRYQVEANTFL